MNIQILPNLLAEIIHITKFSEKSEDKKMYLQICPKIRDLSKDNWQRLSARRAFFLSTTGYRSKLFGYSLQIGTAGLISFQSAWRLAHGVQGPLQRTAAGAERGAH